MKRKGDLEMPITANDVRAMYEHEKARRKAMARALRWMADELETGTGVVLMEHERSEEDPPFPLSELAMFSGGQKILKHSITFGGAPRAMVIFDIAVMGGDVADFHA